MRQKAASPLHSKNMERKCAGTIGTVPRFPGLSISNDKILMYFSQIKYTEAIVSNNTRKVLWLEITKMLIAVQEKILRHLLYFFQHTFVPYWAVFVYPGRHSDRFSRFVRRSRLRRCAERCIAGSEAEPQPKSNLVHFSFSWLQQFSDFPKL